jgi:hypothetical protein
VSEREGTFRRRLCVAVDIQGYTPHSGPWQAEAQRALAWALDEAASQCGLRREDWWRQDSGDGEMAVIDDDGCEPVVVERFPIAVSEALRTASPKGDVRVRLAVHHGVAQPAAKGYAGPGVNEVSRILNADAVRGVLDAVPGANLALLLSERTFLDVVRRGYTALRTADFQPLAVRNKEFSERVWVTVPGADLTLDLPDQAEPDDPEQGASVRQTATGRTVWQAGRDVRIDSYNDVTGDLHAPIRIRGRRRG